MMTLVASDNVCCNQMVVREATSSGKCSDTLPVFFRAAWNASAN